MSRPSLALKSHFRNLQDPRRKHGQRHRLLDIITIAICAVIAGSNSWTDIAAFGRRRQAWLKRFLALPNGIPSHDTFERVFQLINPQVFAACFRQWMLALAGPVGSKHIAIDGKTLRSSGSADLGPLQLVNAWATQNHLSLGQVAVAADSNEITAIPRLLELLDVHGALVSIDAIGCQKVIADQIRQGGGHYVLTVKGNQENLLNGIQHCIAEAAENDFADVDHDSSETIEEGRGRHEKRSYLIIRNPEGIPGQEEWRDLNVIGMCYHERTVNGVTREEGRYFIGSKKASARTYGQALRNHWRIENCLHWQMDVSFREDDNRTRARNAAQNMAQLRRVAVTLLKRVGQGSIANKRLQAAWDTDFLEEVLQGSAKLANE